jgi:hypothetical protein
MVPNQQQTVCGAERGLSIERDGDCGFIVHSSCIHFHMQILVWVTSQMSMLRARGCPDGVRVDSSVSEVMRPFWTKLTTV